MKHDLYFITCSLKKFPVGDNAEEVIFFLFKLKWGFYYYLESILIIISNVVCKRMHQFRLSDKFASAFFLHNGKSRSFHDIGLLHINQASIRACVFGCAAVDPLCHSGSRFKHLFLFDARPASRFMELQIRGHFFDCM